MNELKNFSFEGRQIRALTIEGEPYFVGKDVAEVLGYSNSTWELLFAAETLKTDSA